MPSGIGDEIRVDFKTLAARTKQRDCQRLIESRHAMVAYRPTFNRSPDPAVAATTACSLLSISSADEGLADWKQRIDRGPAGAFVSVTNGGRLLLARGKAGVEQMFFKSTEQGVVFCSDLRILNRLGLEIDRRSCAAFLHYFYIPAPRTIYKKVRSLLPGELCTFDSSGSPRSTHFADCFIDEADAGFRGQGQKYTMGDFENAVKAATANTLSLAVGRAALLLSGGKDSSGLAVAASLSGMEDLETVTVAFPGHSDDEGEDAAVVARSLGLRHRVCHFTADDYIAAFPDFLASIGQPMGDPAAVPLYLLFRELGEQFGSIVDGTGNDAYFGLKAGRRGKKVWWMRQNLPRVARLAGRIGDWLELTGHGKAGQFLIDPQEQFVSWRGFSKRQSEHMCGTSVGWREFPVYRLYDRCPDPDTHMTRTVTEIWEPEAAYRKVVQQSLNFDFDVCYPYLDPVVEKTARGMPPASRFRGSKNKIALRAMLEKNLPNDIVEKPKGSFIFPKADLLTKCKNTHLAFLLDDPWESDTLALDSVAFRSIHDEYQEKGNVTEGQMYALYMLVSWLDSERRTRDLIPGWLVDRA